jgi:hypothetical protein
VIVIRAQLEWQFCFRDQLVIQIRHGILEEHSLGSWKAKCWSYSRSFLDSQSLTCSWFAYLVGLSSINQMSAVIRAQLEWQFCFRDQLVIQIRHGILEEHSLGPSYKPLFGGGVHR